jgi:hypothetical protein
MVGIAQMPRATQHSGRNVNAVYVPHRPDRVMQVGKIPAGATSNLKNAATPAQPEMTGGLSTQTAREEE